jgi:dipeptidyl aminopeptidase/acylaminoacyl peptidase
MKSIVRRALLLSAAAASLAGVVPAHAAFPGENGRIAFYRDFDTQDRRLFTMNPDGSGLSEVFQGSGSSPGWSADGERIALQFCPNINLPSCGIWTMNGDGSDPLQLTSSRFDGTGDVGPSWSPAGTRIAFTRGNRSCGDPACGGDIHVMNADGSGITNITNHPAEDQDPAWSPDGELIAFRSDRGGDEEIYTMRPDGSEIRRLTDAAASGSRFDAAPNWSPDGAKLVFARSGDFPGIDIEVFTVTRDGSEETRITFDPRLNLEPAWSPDGSKIVMYSAALFELRYDIEVINADGSGNTRITSGPEQDVDPDWQSIPSRAPACSSVHASPVELLPANRRFRTVVLSGGADPDGDPVTLSIDGVTQDEPVRGTGDRTSPDARPNADSNAVRLRAERNPRGDGRVYRIAFSVSDDRGKSCTGVATVDVPRRGKDEAVDSAPPEYDSFAR